MDTKDVTLLAISSIMIPETIEVLQRCSGMLDFGAVKLITHERPPNLPSNIVYEQCPRINNIMDFNQYGFIELGKHVSTTHSLTVQYHAWILRPELWDDSWLQYDYIGAPWPYRDDAYITKSGEHIRVGNSGFSLRSKKLLDLPKQLNLPLTHDRGYYNEDGNICVYYRQQFLEQGIKYAPIDVAVRFSYENPIPENDGIESFGFHRNIR